MIRRLLTGGGGGSAINGILFRDILFMMVFIMYVLVVLMLPHLNPPASTKQADPPGNLIVHISWPEGDTDVDLWLDGPAEPVPVGYSNKGGVLWNLLRDDLGTKPDATPLNYENAFTRGVVPGEYTINVHCFRCPTTPVPVDVEISLNNDAGKQGAKGASKILVTTQAILKKNGQEKTAINFKMDAEGNVDDASMNSIHRPLRSGRKQ